MGQSLLDWVREAVVDINPLLPSEVSLSSIVIRQLRNFAVVPSKKSSRLTHGDGVDSCRRLIVLKHGVLCSMQLLYNLNELLELGALLITRRFALLHTVLQKP
ncbi:hypothetical protein E4U13_001354 [Claviceps humidiphila]|uniref:Uncharacterized protein n=1 Tax=Claviceps humidiphila TaxID=1294629 RepID=A0A9P7TY49_9HYPO|nr:hypothetical protein E4U13_001354 [Claviceps humidiphila]